MPESIATLVDLYTTSTRRFASRPLYGTKTAEGWEWTTYERFGELVDRCRAGLTSLGVRSGDRIAIVSNNRLEWAVLAYATYGLGGVFVPMYRSQRPDERRFILADSAATVAVAETEEILGEIEAARADLPALRHTLGLELPQQDARSYAALLRLGEASPSPVAQVASGDLAGLIYTSGTTGNPKGVKLSHRNIVSNVEGILEIFPITPDDRTLSFLPWAHSYGQTCEVHTLMRVGASTAINDDVTRLLDNLAEVRPTMLLAVPTIFNRIYDAVNAQLNEKPQFLRSLVRSAIASAGRLRQGGDSPGVLESAKLRLVDRLVFAKVRDRFGGRLRYAISGSAALNREVAEFIDALGIPFYEGYGLTETSPIVAANAPGARKIGSVGRPLPGVRVVIDKPPGAAATAEGEIVVYGPNVMMGYHNRPQEEAGILTSDGGLRTGDLGYLDADGFLFITGRSKEQYKLENGKYVMPTPLEDALRLSPFIAHAVLHGSGKPYNVVLIDLQEAAVRDWAKREGVELGILDSDARVKDLIESELNRHSAHFRSYERPRKFIVTAYGFSTENGFLTPTLKLKRRRILETFGSQLEALYAEPSTASRALG